MEFVIITESVRGKLSNRAVHIRPLPKGTVTFEEALAGNSSYAANTSMITSVVQVHAVVTLEPRVFPAEVPGKCSLALPVLREGEALNEIELWPRCLPDTMICRSGDTLVLDVILYKREKIYFARSVRLLEYEPLGREVGTVVRVREGENYGFLRSDLRETNVYFRLRDVTFTGPNGVEAAKPEQIRMGAVMAFNLLVDESHAGNKLKGVRLHILDEEKVQNASRRVLIAERCEGIVVREASKDQSGQLKLNDVVVGEMTDEELLRKAYRDTIAAVRRFIACHSINELTVENLMTCQRKALYEILDLLSGCISHELLDASPGQMSLGSGVRSVRLKKLSSEEFAVWRKNNVTEGIPAADDSRDVINFLKSDSDERCGPLFKDSIVVMDIYYDRRVGRLIARDVVVKEEVPPDAQGEQRGVVAVVKSKTQNSRYGLLRVYPTNEKIFWHSSCVRNGVDICEGMEVGFKLRLRSGIRCAVDISPSNGLNREEIAEGLVEAVVMEGVNAIIVKVNECSAIKDVYIDLENAVYKIKRGDVEMWSRDASSATNSREDSAEQDPNKATQFFTPVPRSPIPIESGEQALMPGSVVRCRAVMNWALSMVPVRLIVTEVSNAVAMRYRGVVNRVKVRAGVALLTELKKDALLESGQPMEGWQPDADDVMCYSEESMLKRRGVHVGDLVDFTVFPGTAIAFNISEHRVGGTEQEVVFRKSVNSALKSGTAKAAGSVIIMAEGPPEDNAVGFKSGWRDAPSLEDLSWAHLLAHLK